MCIALPYPAAVRYGQGAIYAYEPIVGEDAGGGGSGTTLLRRTVPAAMGQQVEADVKVVRCERPALRFSEPNLRDDEY